MSVRVCLFVCVQLFDSLWGQALTVTVVCSGMFFGLLFSSVLVGKLTVTGACGFVYVPSRTRRRVLARAHTLARVRAYICALTCTYAYGNASD